MFPTDIIRTLQLTIQVLRRLKWVFIFLFYSGAFWMAAESHDPRYLLLIVPPVLLSSLAYVRDKEREKHGMDDFRGDWLFFRYGEPIFWAVLSIPVNDSWSFAATHTSAMTLRMTLAEHIAGRLPVDAVQVISKKVITDRQSKEQKEFTRVVVRSRFGSQVTFFIHYAAFGHTITAQYFVYRRGAQSEWEAVKFIFASPLTIWFWGIAWLRNRYSVVTNISPFRKSSFDVIDLDTMYQVTRRTVWEETRRVLQMAGLLTEEIRQAIQYHITNVQNPLFVSNSTVGNVSQLATGPQLPAAQQPAPA